jgi:hypothetical protein
MKMTDHSGPPSHSDLAAVLSDHVATSAAHPFSPLAESLSENRPDEKLPDNSHYLPDNDRISSVIVRIIPSKKHHLTHVISETYDFFYHNPRTKTSISCEPLASNLAPRAKHTEVRLEKRITQVRRSVPLQTPHCFLTARQGNLCFCSDAMTARPTSLNLVSAFSPAKEGRLHV